MDATVAMRLGGDGHRTMARRINFTADALRRIICPPGKRDVHVYDSKIPGLSFRITNNNATAFYLYRRVNGRPTRIRLGGKEITIEQARRMAANMNGAIAAGDDPSEPKRAQRKSESLRDLFDRWCGEYAETRLSHKTLITDKSRFNTCLDTLASRKVLAITEADIRTIHERIGRERGHVSANRAVQLISRIFNWARLSVNPAARAVDMFHEQSRERFIQPDELPRLFKALDGADVNPLIRDFVYMSLFTGQRRANVSAMRMNEIDLSAATWTIPAASSKNRKTITLPLSKPALDIIKRRWGHESGFIFPAHSKSGHLEEPSITWRKVLEHAGLKDLRLHDLRRTFGSFQAAAGSSLQIIGKSLGHESTAATAIYSRLYLDPVRQSVNNAVGAIVAAGRRKQKKRQKQAAAG
jgi:integrase